MAEPFFVLGINQKTIPITARSGNTTLYIVATAVFQFDVSVAIRLKIAVGRMAPRITNETPMVRALFTNDIIVRYKMVIFKLYIKNKGGIDH
jgi:hypothetical protein